MSSPSCARAAPQPASSKEKPRRSTKPVKRVGNEAAYTQQPGAGHMHHARSHRAAVRHPQPPAHRLALVPSALGGGEEGQLEGTHPEHGQLGAVWQVPRGASLLPGISFPPYKRLLNEDVPFCLSTEQMGISHDHIKQLPGQMAACGRPLKNTGNIWRLKSVQSLSGSVFSGS